MAMLVVTLAASTAAFAVWHQTVWLRQIENITARGQANILVDNGMEWMRGVLYEDLHHGNPGIPQGGIIDDLSEDWAQEVTVVPDQLGELNCHIVDEQARINLNNLVLYPDKTVVGDEIEALRRLFRQLGLPEDLTNAIRDWADEDSEVSVPDGAEDLEYLDRRPPYRSANRPLADINELYLISGFTEEIVNQLKPFVTALPKETTVNVNTAPPEVLAALFQDLSLDEARELLQVRELGPFTHEKDFLNQLSRDVKPRKTGFDVSSKYFRSTCQAKVAKVEVAYEALIFRDVQGWPSIIWQRLLVDD